MFTNILKIASLTSVCVASFLLAGSVLAESHSGSPNRASGTRMSTPSRQTNSRPTAKKGTTVASNRGETPLRATRFGNTRNFDRNYGRTHGRSFRYGTYYQGRNHYHWSHYCWWARYGCYAYWCPSTNCYYYWSETASCYYPVSYAEVVAPTASTQLLNINVNNNNNNNNTNVVTTNAPGTAPVAIPALPTGGSAVGAELPAPTE
jgi:hypothetical protein